MIITCKECNSSFNVDDSLIKETGSKVRCSKCETIFLAYPRSPENELLLDSDEQLLDTDGSSELDDLESSLDGFFSEDESLETAALQKDADDELGLGLGLDLDDGAGPDAAETSMIGDELPDLEELSALEDEPVAADDTEALLEDLDLDLESEEKQEVSDAEFSIDNELDPANLNLEKEESTELEAPSTEDSEDLNLDLLLDPDTDNQEGSELVEAGLEVEETDELDLSDLGLESEDPPVAETASGEDPGDLDLDLLLDPDTENQEGSELAEAGLEVEETDELDLSDLNLESDDSPVAETALGEDSEDLDFDLDLDSETVAGAAENMADELDLSDLEEIIDSESDEPAGNTPNALETELELKDDHETQAADPNSAVEDDDELDFSDLEKMLESDEAPEPSAEGEDADELDLQFDIDEPNAGIVDAPVSSDADQIDELLDIDKMLEENEDTVDENLESPLEMDVVIDEASKGKDDFELDFDIESELQEKEDLFDGSATADEQLESNLLTSDETGTSDEAGMEELEFDEEELQGAVTTDEFATDELLETSDAYDSTDVPRTIDDPPSAPAAMMPKSRSKKPVLVALLLLFLAGGALIVPNMLGIKIPYLSDLDIKIPYLSDKFNPKEKDVTGNLKIIPLGGTIAARFVNDSQGNPRFVIHGKIKNDYDHPRSFIKVTGKIYQKGGKLAKTETVFCGNLLSDSELTGMKIAAINKRLHNRFGDKKSNLKVKTGKSIPFMIVFDKLPQNLDEYTIEVDGSSI